MAEIYLDYAASCPVDPKVVKAMAPMWSCGNPASSHAAGRRADAKLTRARAHVANAIGASPDEVVFTSGATEADNWAIKGYVQRASDPLLVFPATEHKAILRSAEAVSDWGTPSVVLPVDSWGRIDLNQLWEAARPGALVSVMAANNETGVVQSLREIGEICHERRALFHSDAAQGLGRMPLDVDELGVDLMSLSAHKIYGPKGVGALYIRKGVEIEPLVHGGRQENGRRAGTSNPPLVVGFAKAAQLATACLRQENPRLWALQGQLLDSIRQIAPGVRVNGEEASRVPGIVSLGFPGADPEELLAATGASLCCSSGSACELDGPSHVMEEMGVDCAVLRISLGRWTTTRDAAIAGRHIARSAVAAGHGGSQPVEQIGDGALAWA
jgi:cysteine desulfurase